MPARCAAGIRYQTNANRAPTDSIILLNGLPFTLDPDFAGLARRQCLCDRRVPLSHDCESQGDTLEVDLITYASKQFEREELDVALAELTVGPAFDMGRFGIDNAALGIYGIGSGVLLGEDFYSAGVGAGTRFVIRPKPSTSLLAALEYRHKDYHDSDSSPTASLRNGDELRAFGTAPISCRRPLVLTATPMCSASGPTPAICPIWKAGSRSARAIPSPRRSPATCRAWIVALNTGALFREYDDPDPIISLMAAEERLGSLRRRRPDRPGEARRRADHRDGIPPRRFELRHPQIRQFLDLAQRREELLTNAPRP